MNVPIELIIIVLAALASWFIAQLFKMLWLSKPSVGKALGTSGGMPSAHTATVISLVVLLFFYEGFTSTVALAILFAAIVIRDSIGVRLAVGINGMVLKESLTKNKKLQKKVMIEHGHTIEHVLVGAAIGLVVAFATYLLFLV